MRTTKYLKTEVAFREARIKKDVKEIALLERCLICVKNGAESFCSVCEVELGRVD